MRFIWTTIGILAVILVIAVWQFGFFHSQVKDISTKIDRATAVDRANAMIDSTQSQADSLKDRSRQLLTDARKTELSVERDEEKLVRLELAFKQLAQTLKTAGLPCPSKMGTLTDEQKQTKIVFAGREGSALEAYNQILKWNSEFLQKKAILDAKRNLIERQRAAADSMIVKQGELYAVIEKIKIQLAKLETEREIARINAQMAELGATEAGVNIGELGKFLDAIQDEIDDLNAKTDIANTEAGKPTSGDVFSIPDVASTAEENNSLDLLWTKQSISD